MMENVNNFLTEIIDEDIANGLSERIHTRFPPEPNGYLHIGSAKAIFINWSIAKKYNGLFNLRYDDTNPVKEDTEYVDSIWEDIKWLTGEEPSGGVFYGSDYFETCFECAVQLIKDGKAYVDDLTQEEMREYRGSLTEPGKPSPYRDRSVEENLQLFRGYARRQVRRRLQDPARQDRHGQPEHEPARPGDLPHRPRTSSPSGRQVVHLSAVRLRAPHSGRARGHHALACARSSSRTTVRCTSGSLTTAPLPHHPKQREFARLNVTHTVMSKRYLRQLVFEKHVEGWDDPRMPTLCALRRRGYTPSAILDFVQRAGIAKANSLVDIKLLEHCIREELNDTALRRMAVTEPVKLVITNYPEGQCEEFEVPNNPRNEEAGTRKVPFTRELYIEKSDFAEVPPPKFQRLKPDGEVRLMGAYIVKCNEIVKDDNGEIVEIRCTADLETRNGMPVDGRKVKGTIHWVSAEHAIDADLYLYDNLFTLENVNDVPEGTDYLDYLNPDSLKKLTGCKLEPSLADAKEGERFQFVRMGYYCKDRETGRFNRIVTLKDSFAKTLSK